jgi:hypothetical protein
MFWQAGLGWIESRRESGDMRSPKLILIAGLAAVVFISPAAMGAAKGTNRPLTGTVTLTTTVNLITLAGTQVASGQLSQLGKVTDSGNLQFALEGPNGFSFTVTYTIVAANGDKLVANGSGTGDSGPPITSTSTNTIVGGTGRFAGASGSFTVTAISTSVSTIGSIRTVTQTGTLNGTITY